MKPAKKSKRRTYQIGIAQQFVVEGYASKPQLISCRVPQESIMGLLLLSTNIKDQQQVVTLRVCASRWTEVCGGIGSQRTQQRKMAPLLKITIVLVICSIFVECR